jgi:hypothetical protein
MREVGSSYLCSFDADVLTKEATMRVMIFVKATADSEKKEMDPNDPWAQEMMKAMGEFNNDLDEAGILVDAGGLKPTSQAKRVAFHGGSRTVSDGPFGQANDLVAGYWIWDVKDMEEAIAWVRRCPNPMPGPSEIEIRPFYELGNPLR